MWKTLKPGEPVSVGDTIRYRSNGDERFSSKPVYRVIKEDQHYFEICSEEGVAEKRDAESRKFIRYIDIGYNLGLERWYDPPAAFGA